MYPTNDLDTARVQLARELLRRAEAFPPPAGTRAVQAPIGIFLTRPSEEDMARRVEASINYWHLDSGSAFDVLFPGWRRTGGRLSLDDEDFHDVVSELEHRSTWTYSGETDLLLLEFVVELELARGDFSFEHAHSICLSQLARTPQWASLDRFMRQMVISARSQPVRDETTTAWGLLRDDLATDWVRQGFWAMLRERLVAPFLGARAADMLQAAETVRSVRPSSV